MFLPCCDNRWQYFSPYCCAHLFTFECCQTLCEQKSSFFFSKILFKINSSEKQICFWDISSVQEEEYHVCLNSDTQTNDICKTCVFYDLGLIPRFCGFIVFHRSIIDRVCYARRSLQLPLASYNHRELTIRRGCTRYIFAEKCFQLSQTCFYCFLQCLTTAGEARRPLLFSSGLCFSFFPVRSSRMSE